MLRIFWWTTASDWLCLMQPDACIWQIHDIWRSVDGCAVYTKESRSCAGQWQLDLGCWRIEQSTFHRKQYSVPELPEQVCWRRRHLAEMTRSRPNQEKLTSAMRLAYSFAVACMLLLQSSAQANPVSIMSVELWIDQSVSQCTVQYS